MAPTAAGCMDVAEGSQGGVPQIATMRMVVVVTQRQVKYYVTQGTSLIRQQVAF